MPRGARLLIDNACYHIYARGNHKENIFKGKADYKAYLERLKRYKKRYRLLVYGYCLMPNHVHIIADIPRAVNLSYFIHDLNRSYTAFFNKKYKKEGCLWQGRFRSKIISRDQYLVNCINYVELNPVRSGLVSSPLDYPYSSYKERVLEMKGNIILNKLALTSFG